MLENVRNNIKYVLSHNLVKNYSKKVHKNIGKCDLIYRESVLKITSLKSDSNSSFLN